MVKHSVSTGQTQGEHSPNTAVLVKDGHSLVKPSRPPCHRPSPRPLCQGTQRYCTSIHTCGSICVCVYVFLCILNSPNLARQSEHQDQSWQYLDKNENRITPSPYSRAHFRPHTHVAVSLRHSHITYTHTHMGRLLWFIHTHTQTHMGCVPSLYGTHQMLCFLGIQLEPDLGTIQPQTPSPHASFGSRYAIYWLGIQPRASSLRFTKGTSLTGLATRRPPPTRPGPVPRLPPPWCSLCLTPLSLLTLPVPLVLLPISLERIAVRPGKLACSSTRVTHHAHTGSSTASAHG